MKRTKSILMHLAGWIGYFNLIAWSFSSFTDWDHALQRAGVICGVHGLLFYLNAFILMPRLLDRKKILFYAASLVGALAFVVLIMQGPGEQLLSRRSRTTQAKIGANEKHASEYHENRRRFGGRRGWIDPRIFAILMSSSAALFVSAVYFNIQNRRRKDQELLDLKNQSLEAEKRFLKSQINPHFLFNTLNNLYALATIKSNKTADAIQQLSEILRYSIYESESKLVPLEKEIEYIRHYVELESLKDETIAQKVSLNIDQFDQKVKLPPMMLLPFIENAFKHGNLTLADNAYLTISMTLQNHELIFKCENSISQAPMSKDKTGGIGLQNVKRRLELLYPGQFELEISNQDQYFGIALKLIV